MPKVIIRGSQPPSTLHHDALYTWLEDYRPLLTVFQVNQWLVTKRNSYFYVTGNLKIMFASSKLQVTIKLRVSLPVSLFPNTDQNHSLSDQKNKLSNLFSFIEQNVRRQIHILTHIWVFKRARSFLSFSLIFFFSNQKFI